MMIKHFRRATAISAVFFSIAGWAAQDAENTRRNERDRNPRQLTADDQSNSKEDIALTREIRQELVKTGGFSTNARNVKIITIGGVVTLKGPVDSFTEKKQIERIAVAKAGGLKKVVSQLEVRDQRQAN